MSYRLISSNDIAIKYPEVNDMPCIYADLPNGMDGEHYVLEQEPKTDTWSIKDVADTFKKHGLIREQQPKTGHWIEYGELYQCSECKELSCCQGKFCNECGAKMVEPQERSGNDNR